MKSYACHHHACGMGSWRATPRRFVTRRAHNTIVRATASDNDYQNELREQIRKLAQQGWTFKKPRQPSKTRKQFPKMSRTVITEQPEVMSSSQEGLNEATSSNADSSSAVERPVSPSGTGPSPTATTSIPIENPPVPPVLQAPPRAPPASPSTTSTPTTFSSLLSAAALSRVDQSTAAASTSVDYPSQPPATSIGQSTGAASTNVDQSTTQGVTNGTAASTSTGTSSGDSSRSSSFGRDRVGYSVASGTDLSSLTRSIISILNKEDGCWVAAASPTNCTLALQAITSARKAAMHAGLFEIVLQPSIINTPTQKEPRLEFFLTKFELDRGSDPFQEAPFVYPGTWPTNDEEFGHSIAQYLHERQQVVLRCGGVNHSSQAARALVFAQDALYADELELQVSPSWHVSEVDRSVKLDLLVELMEVDDAEEEEDDVN